MRFLSQLELDDQTIGLLTKPFKSSKDFVQHINSKEILAVHLWEEPDILPIPLEWALKAMRKGEIALVASNKSLPCTRDLFIRDPDESPQVYKRKHHEMLKAKHRALKEINNSNVELIQAFNFWVICLVDWVKVERLDTAGQFRKYMLKPQPKWHRRPSPSDVVIAKIVNEDDKHEATFVGSPTDELKPPRFAEAVRSMKVGEEAEFHLKDAGPYTVKLVNILSRIDIVSKTSTTDEPVNFHVLETLPDDIQLRHNHLRGRWDVMAVAIISFIQSNGKRAVPFTIANGSSAAVLCCWPLYRGNMPKWLDDVVMKLTPPQRVRGKIPNAFQEAYTTWEPQSCLILPSIPEFAKDWPKDNFGLSFIENAIPPWKLSRDGITNESVSEMRAFFERCGIQTEWDSKRFGFPQEFEVQLLGYAGQGVSPWLLTDADRLARSASLRQEGNKFLLTGHYSSAIHLYKEAIDVLQYMVCDSQVELTTGGPPAIKRGSRDPVTANALALLHSNTALAFIRLGRWKDTVKHCDEGLLQEPTLSETRAKLCFRRALGFYHTEEYDAALESLSCCDINDVAVLKLIKDVKQAKNRYSQTAKTRCAAMFS